LTCVTGTLFYRSKFCLPHLKVGRNPHILNIAPPLMHLTPERFSGHVAYTMAKYGMSIFVTGMAEEFRSDGIAVNALWPKSGTGKIFICIPAYASV
jgi:citronellol/citronellal dehydrogenase